MRDLIAIWGEEEFQHQFLKGHHNRDIFKCIAQQIQSEAWPHVDILVHDVGGNLGDDIREGGPTHAEGLSPLFIVPGTQDNLLPPIAAGGMGPELVLDSLEVVPEHPAIHGILDVFVSHMKVGGPVQDT
ncbi:hypothetical protein Y1Q_0000621 [Alligator mississippiensis]|uniref:Uncharacterized protein n=1 Tax=Alligator mississippiensis TaxID=8496 RepID=A0A151MBT5_ALLMI|nr:hypothetical protein Y1Q_0000621 [Alligator mississippiensis]